MPKYCPECGNQLEYNDAKHCEHCGFSLIKKQKKQNATTKRSVKQKEEAKKKREQKKLQKINKFKKDLETENFDKRIVSFVKRYKGNWNSKKKETKKSFKSLLREIYGFYFNDDMARQVWNCFYSSPKPFKPIKKPKQIDLVTDKSQSYSKSGGVLDSVIKIFERIDNEKRSYYKKRRERREEFLVGMAKSMGLNPQKRDTPIRCPLCGKEFKPCDAQVTGDSAFGTVVKGIIFLPWGMLSATKGRGIVCPHCHMVLKII